MAATTQQDLVHLRPLSGSAPPLGQPNAHEDQHRAGQREPHRDLPILPLQDDRVRQIQQDAAEFLGVLGLEVLATGQLGDLGQCLLVDLPIPAATESPEVLTAEEAALKSLGSDYTERYGFSFAKGPFGPQDINGVWNAKVLVKGKVVRRGKVTVAC